MTHRYRTYGYLLLVSLTLPPIAQAADAPYAGQEQRAIKALSPQEVDDYLQGRGMGTSKPAELNHYPGPKHVLDAAAALTLSETQTTSRDRVLHYLETESDHGCVILQVTRKAWAAELGLTHEALYRVLAQLTREKTIRIDERAIRLAR